MPASARDPSSLPTPAILRRRCEALARLDRALAPDAVVPTHDFDRRANTFWLRESVWYSIHPNRGGAMVAGELDLRRVPA